MGKKDSCLCSLDFLIVTADLLQLLACGFHAFGLLGEDRMAILLSQFRQGLWRLDFVRPEFAEHLSILFRFPFVFRRP